MTQSSSLGAIANGTGAVVRANINTVCQAIVTENAGASAPSPTYPFMKWNDTDDFLLYRRNAGNTDWEIIDNYGATVKPTEDDDGTEKYIQGSFWKDISTNKIYICLDASTGAAVWKELCFLTNMLDFTTSSTTDFAASLQAAANSLSGGGIIFIPPGTFELGSTVTIPDGVILVGAGTYATILRITSATANTLVLGDACELHHIRFQPTVTRTAGFEVDAQGNQITIDSCSFVNYFIAVSIGTFDGTYTDPLIIDTALNNCNFNGVAAAGSCAVLINYAGNVGIDNCIISGPTSGLQPDSAIRPRHVDTLVISNTNVTKHGKGLFADPGSGMFVGAIKVTNSLFDSAGQITGGSYVPSAELAPSSGGSVVNCNFNGTWFGLASNSQGCNLLPSGTGVINGITFTGCDFVDNYDYGLLIAGTSTNIKVNGGTSAGHGAGSGIRLAGTVSEVEIIGHRAGNVGARGANNIGIVIDASVTGFYKVDGCNLRGNTSAGLTDGGGSSSRQIRNNAGYVTENAGAGVILSGTTSITVNHGFSRTPAAHEIWLTPVQNTTNDPGNIWIDTITSTQFKINCRNNPGASNLAVYWGGRLL